MPKNKPVAPKPECECCNRPMVLKCMDCGKRLCEFHMFHDVHRHNRIVCFSCLFKLNKKPSPEEK